MRGRTGRTEAIREAPTAMHVRSMCEACEASSDGIMLRAQGLGTHAPVGGSAGRTQRARAPGRADTARARTHPTPSRARSGRVPSSPRLRAARRARRSGVCLLPLVRRWRDATPATWTEWVSRCGGGGGGGRDGRHDDGGGVTTREASAVRGADTCSSTDRDESMRTREVPTAWATLGGVGTMDSRGSSYDMSSSTPTVERGENAAMRPSCSWYACV